MLNFLQKKTQFSCHNYRLCHRVFCHRSSKCSKSNQKLQQHQRHWTITRPYNMVTQMRSCWTMNTQLIWCRLHPINILTRRALDCVNRHRHRLQPLRRRYHNRGHWQIWQIRLDLWVIYTMMSNAKQWIFWANTTFRPFHHCKMLIGMHTTMAHSHVLLRQHQLHRIQTNKCTKDGHQMTITW